MKTEDEGILRKRKRLSSWFFSLRIGLAGREKNQIFCYAKHARGARQSLRAPKNLIISGPRILFPETPYSFTPCLLIFNYLSLSLSLFLSLSLSLSLSLLSSPFSQLSRFCQNFWAVYISFRYHKLSFERGITIRLCAYIMYFLHQKMPSHGNQRVLSLFTLFWTRPDTRLPKSRAGGLGQWWNRSAKQRRSSNPKNASNCQKSKALPTDGRTNQQTVRVGCRVACMRLKRKENKAG